MKAVIQRVSRASVCIGGRQVTAVGAGYLILLGVTACDESEDAERLAAKISVLRICGDEQGKINKSILDTAGEIIVVSNFTLCADCSHGRRPSFIGAAPPEKGEILYEYFTDCLRSRGIPVCTGEFGADMQVDLCNDGPVTILLDSGDL